MHQVKKIKNKKKRGKKNARKGKKNVCSFSSLKPKYCPLPLIHFFYNIFLPSVLV